MSDDGEWYWCLDHQRVEGADTTCPADHRLGPFATQTDAANWKATFAARNRAWDKDEEVDDADEDGGGGEGDAR